MFGNLLKSKLIWCLVSVVVVIAATCWIYKQVRPIHIDRSAVAMTARSQYCRDYLVPAFEEFYRKSNTNGSLQKRIFKQFVTEEYKYPVFVGEKPDSLKEDLDKFDKFGIFIQLPPSLYDAEEGQIVAYTKPIRKAGEFFGARCAVIVRDSKLKTTALSETEFHSAVQNGQIQNENPDIYLDLTKPDT